MKKQLVSIHGGETFASYDEYLGFLKKLEIDFEDLTNPAKKWRRNLGETLGQEFTIIAPEMPNSLNAKYMEWEIWFDKIVPHLDSQVMLLGHSLGASFLAKYLSENKFTKRISALFLVAACFDDEGLEYSLDDFKMPEDLSGIAKQADKIFLYHSEDDPVVPFAHLQKFSKAIPGATLRIFKDRGHFLQEEFLEIVEDIKGV